MVKVSEEAEAAKRAETSITPPLRTGWISCCNISEYGFLMFYMLDTLYYLGTSDFEGSNNYPLNQFSKEQFIKLRRAHNPKAIGSSGFRNTNENGTGLAKEGLHGNLN